MSGPPSNRRVAAPVLARLGTVAGATVLLWLVLSLGVHVHDVMAAIAVGCAATLGGRILLQRPQRAPVSSVSSARSLARRPVAPSA